VRASTPIRSMPRVARGTRIAWLPLHDPLTFAATGDPTGQGEGQTIINKESGISPRGK
jgi:hypothetical protein